MGANPAYVLTPMLMVGFPPKMSPRPEVEDDPDDEEEGTTALITKNAAITATMIRTTLNPGLSCAIFLYFL